jgi:hypothetical protein
MCACLISGANLEEIAICGLDGGRDGTYSICIAVCPHS